MKFNKQQKDGLAKVFLNLAQVVATVLVIGNIATPEKFSWTLVSMGILLFFLFLAIGTFLNRGE